MSCLAIRPANKTVNASDISQTKTKAGEVVDASNFREDVTASGDINAPTSPPLRHTPAIAFRKSPAHENILHAVYAQMRCTDAAYIGR